MYTSYNKENKHQKKISDEDIREFEKFVEISLNKEKDYLEFINLLEKNVDKLKITTSQLRKFYNMLFEISEERVSENLEKEKKALLYRMRILLEYARRRGSIDEIDYSFFKLFIESVLKDVSKFDLFKESFEAIVAFSKDKKEVKK